MRAITVRGEATLTPEADVLERISGLLACVAGQDRQAFVDLFRITAPRVKSYMRRLGCSLQQAEDIAQEVMLAVWRKAGQYDSGKSGPLTWIFVIARNLRIDMLRREKSFLIYGAEQPERAADVAVSPDDRLVGVERDVQVRAAMAELTQEQRELLRRSFFDDEPHTAIAHSLGLPLGTVKSRLRSAMGKLRLRLASAD